MAEVPDDLEKLLTEVRKTISDNKLFLENLVDEAIESDSEEGPEAEESEADFEEL